MITRLEVDETNKMIRQENLDVRTITLGISLLDCISDDIEKLKENIRNILSRLFCSLSLANPTYPSSSVDSTFLSLLP